MKMISYKKTGNYYIDDDDNSKAFEYLFYFDDGVAFVYYLTEESMPDFLFDESNPDIRAKYDEAVKNGVNKDNVLENACDLRKWLCREYGIENTFFND